MELASLTEIRAQIESRAALIGASGDMLPTYGRSADGGQPHIEVDSHSYHYINVERGEELSCVTTRELDELLYVALSSAASSLGSRYAVNHRARGQDFRRAMFQHQLELLSRLAPHWAERCAKEHEHVLREHPFNDR